MINSLDKKIISWTDYLYMGLLFAVLMSIGGEYSDGFYQLVLFAVFFACTGFKENVVILKGFAKKYPLFAGFAVISTIYFALIHRNEFLSYRYAATIFFLVFAGYCITIQGREAVEVALEKLWATLMVLLGVAVVNYLMVHEFKIRMNLFFLNPIPEGDAAVVLLLISLFFIHDKVRKLLGTILACASVLFSVTRHDLILLAIVILVYCVFNRKEIVAYVRKRPVVVLVAVACVCAGLFVLASKTDMVIVTFFIERFSLMFKSMAKDPYLNYYGDQGFRYRVVALIEAIKVARNGSLMEKLLGRGLMSTFNTIGPATKVLANGSVAGPVENAFISFLADFGVISFVMFLGVYVAAIRTLILSKERFLKMLSLFVIITMSTTLFSDMQYWANVSYFIWLFSGMWLGSSIAQKDKKTIALPFVFSGAVAIILYLLPLMYSPIRTVISSLSENISAVAMIIYIIISLGALMVMLWNLCTIIVSLANNKNMDSKAAKLAIVGGALLLFLICFGSIQTAIFRKEIDNRIEKEKDIIEAVQNRADGYVYCDTYPSIYNAVLGNIRGTLFSGASLAADRNVTVIMSIDDEAQRLTDAGFLYLPISEWDVIYTNDQGAIAALKNMGFNPTGYCTREYAASVGENIEIYPGEYTARYSLRLSDNNKYTEDYEVGTIALTKAMGEEDEKEIATKTLMRSSFDEEGVFTEKLEFSTGGKDYTFELSLESDDNVELESIEYTRTPAYDIHFRTDDNYKVAHEEYFDLDGNPVETAGGYHGTEYEYDSMGNWTVKRFLGLNLKPALSTDGYAEIRRYFDDANRIVREEYYGDDLKPIALARGQAAVEYEYDSNGNKSVTRYYDEEFKPVLYNGQYHFMRSMYDDNGRSILDEYFGTDGEPILLSDGASAYRREYDEAGNVAILTYLDTDGNPVINSSGYAILRRAYDDKKQITREEYHDQDDRPIALSRGQAAVEYEYNEAGNKTAYSYYDVSNAPVLYNDQYWRLEITYNDLNQNIMEKYFGIDGRPVVLSDGASGYSREYDEAGNVIILTYLDKESNPVINSSGYAILRRAYDDKKQITREEYHDKDDHPIALSRGQAAEEYEYDEEGNRTAYSYYDVSNEPVLYKDQYWRLEITYNDLKQNIMEKYFDTDGRPVVLSDGASGYSRDYDEAGNVIALTYLDTQYNATTNTSGYSRWRHTFNDNNQIICESYFDTQDAPVALAGGQGAVEYEYDEAGNRTTDRYYDAEGNPVMYYGEYWYVIRTYNDKKQNIREEYYDLDGNLVKEELL